MPSMSGCGDVFTGNTKKGRTMMNSTVKNLWTAALHSGTYKQAKGKLRIRLTEDTDGYCCLGVLCELAVQHNIIPPAKLNRFDRDVYLYGKENGESGSETFLPLKVMRWAGLDSDNPEVSDPEHPGNRVSLAGLNDDGESFDVIADAIDAHL